MHIYEGRRDSEGIPDVERDGEWFDPALSQKIRNHSPDGFEWGYCGSGPAQLALALLMDTLRCWEAIDLYQAFKREIVAGWGRGTDDTWRITSEEILAWVAAHKRKEEGDSTLIV